MSFMEKFDFAYSLEFFTDNFKAANKNKVSKCSSV